MTRLLHFPGNAIESLSTYLIEKSILLGTVTEFTICSYKFRGIFLNQKKYKSWILHRLNRGDIQHTILVLH